MRKTLIKTVIESDVPRRSRLTTYQWLVHERGQRSGTLCYTRNQAGFRQTSSRSNHGTDNRDALQLRMRGTLDSLALFMNNPRTDDVVHYCSCCGHKIIHKKLSASGKCRLRELRAKRGKK